MRAMSAVWGLLATIIFYVLWVRKRRALRSEKLFFALDFVSVPPALRTDGAILHNATDVSFVGDLRSCTLGRAVAKLAAVSAVRIRVGRALVHALLARVSNPGGNLSDGSSST